MSRTMVMNAEKPLPTHRSMTVTDARSEARRLLRVYGHALDTYPESAIFNTTDMALVLHCLNELTRERRRGD